MGGGVGVRMGERDGLIGYIANLSPTKRELRLAIFI